jgi:hypothetical protein
VTLTTVRGLNVAESGAESPVTFATVSVVDVTRDPAGRSGVTS